jgi:hypothetical protein
MMPEKGAQSYEENLNVKNFNSYNLNIYIIGFRCFPLMQI